MPAVDEELVGMDARRVVVAGGGMAGLCAAVAAADAGARVTLLEKSHQLGGSMRISGGLVWTYKDEETAARLVPEGDPALQQLVVGGLTDALAWLADNGVEVGAQIQPRQDTFGREIAPQQLISALVRRLEALGAAIELECGIASLLHDAEGAVAGVRVVRGDEVAAVGSIDADAVVIATGGFQGNPDLVRRLLGVRPEAVQLRANRWSTGDGLLAAQGAGAALTPGISHFYGHAIAAPPAAFPPERSRQATQFYGSKGVAINLAGVRFVDESGGTGEEHVNEALAHQRDGVGFYVVDGDLAAGTAGPGFKIQATIDRAVEYGAPYVHADSLEALCAGLSDFGVSGANALATLTGFRDAMTSGRRHDLDPPRTGGDFALATPPFQAVGVQAGLTFTMGGIAVDASMRVLSRARSTSLIRGPMSGFGDHAAVPIRGLFAAGCDVGDINNHGYMGALAPALVTGRIAGHHATR